MKMALLMKEILAELQKYYCLKMLFRVDSLAFNKSAMCKWAIPVSYVFWCLDFECFPVVFDIVPSVLWGCDAPEPLQHSPFKKEQ